ncbi:MAG: DNA polymerase III subunit gamma/tau [Acidimicrobiales bacterium]
MGYQSLYRRYRSRNFAEIKGQQHVTTALRAAVAEGRHSHAYLFSGPRGTGKTSTARVLAKALNCEHLVDGEPCCECESCLTIEQGKSFDLHELDAASNNKVDDIRDLIAKVALGSPGRTKVYILDEVHMLTAGAENALLKTLEEPPDHVVFVLATTEPHKVVETIRSRTQHFEFKLLPGAELEDHVRGVIADAGLDVDDAGIEFALRQGGGSARDTLSALELVASAGGVPEGSDIGRELALAIGAGDAAAVISSVQAALGRGREPRTIGELTLDTLRQAFLASMGASLDHLSEAAQTGAKEVAEALGAATITRSLETIGTALVEMRQAPDPRVPLEVAMLRLARRDGNDTAALLQRIEALEEQVKALQEGAVPPIAARPQPPVEEVTADSPPPRAAGNGPATAARNVLGDKGPAPAAPRGRPAPPAGARPPQRAAEPSAPQAATPPPAQSAPPQAAPPQSARPQGQPAPQPAASQPEHAAAAPAGGGSISLDRLTGGFDSLLEQLPQRVRARFAPGRFVAIEGGRASFALPNAIAIPRCEEVKGELEARIAEHFGANVTIDLIVDGSTPPRGPRQAPSPAPTPAAPPPPPDEEHADVDVSQLENADVAASSIDRLTQAFPGAQVIEASD